MAPVHRKPAGGYPQSRGPVIVTQRTRSSGWQTRYVQLVDNLTSGAPQLSERCLQSIRGAEHRRRDRRAARESASTRATSSPLVRAPGLCVSRSVPRAAILSCGSAPIWRTSRRTGLPLGSRARRCRVPNVDVARCAAAGFMAVSTRAVGVPLEEVSGPEWHRLVPAIVDLLEALRIAEIPDGGFGAWDGAGLATDTSWSDDLLAVRGSTGDRRPADWYDRLGDRPAVRAAFDAGFARLGRD